AAALPAPADRPGPKLPRQLGRLRPGRPRLDRHRLPQVAESLLVRGLRDFLPSGATALVLRFLATRQLSRLSANRRTRDLVRQRHSGVMSDLAPAAARES